jgi:hypothetical protein
VELGVLLVVLAGLVSTVEEPVAEDELAALRE